MWSRSQQTLTCAHEAYSSPDWIQSLWLDISPSNKGYITLQKKVKKWVLCKTFFFRYKEQNQSGNEKEATDVWKTCTELLTKDQLLREKT